MDRYYYDEIAMGSYTQLSGATWEDDLDIEIDETDWTYTVSDSGDNDAPDYVITATNNSDSDLWAQIDENGDLNKSSLLGGSGTKW